MSDKVMEVLIGCWYEKHSFLKDGSVKPIEPEDIKEAVAYLKAERDTASKKIKELEEKVLHCGHWWERMKGGWRCKWCGEEDICFPEENRIHELEVENEQLRKELGRK